MSPLKEHIYRSDQEVPGLLKKNATTSWNTSFNNPILVDC